MIKNLKNIILSPIFIIQIIISLSVLIVSFVNYKNNIDKDVYSGYDIIYSEDISAYDDEIKDIEETIEELRMEDRLDDNILEYQTDRKKIYEALKLNNIDFEQVYELSIINYDDSTSFLENTNYIFLILLFFNIISVIFLSFTREFDNHRFVYIYEDKRMKTMIKKILSSLIIITILFILYYIVYKVCANSFNKLFTHVLNFEDDKAEFIEISSFELNHILWKTIYCFVFMLALLWASALIGKKSIIFAIISIGIFLLALVFHFTGIGILPYIGFDNNLQTVGYHYLWIPRIAIILPLSLFGLGIWYFNRCDI